MELLSELVKSDVETKMSYSTEELSLISRNLVDSLLSNSNEHIVELIEDLIFERSWIKGLSFIDSGPGNITDRIYNWLQLMPIYRISPYILESVFTRILINPKLKGLTKEVALRKVISLVERKGYGMSSHFLKEQIVKTDSVPLVQIDIYLILLQLEGPKVISFLENSISIDQTPHLAIVLIRAYQQEQPKRSLAYLCEVQNTNFNPSDIEWISYRSTIYTVLYNLFTKEQDEGQAFFLKISEKISANWILEIFEDILADRRFRKWTVEITRNDNQTRKTKPELGTETSTAHVKTDIKLIFDKVYKNPEKSKSIARSMIENIELLQEVCLYFKEEFLVSKNVGLKASVEGKLATYEDFIFTLSTESFHFSEVFFQYTGFKIDLNNRRFFNEEQSLSFSSLPEWGIMENNLKDIKNNDSSRREIARNFLLLRERKEE